MIILRIVYGQHLHGTEPRELSEDHMITEITERQAWNSLQQVRKTTTGPDGVP